MCPLRPKLDVGYVQGETRLLLLVLPNAGIGVVGAIIGEHQHLIQRRIKRLSGVCFLIAEGIQRLGNTICFVAYRYNYGYTQRGGRGRVVEKIRGGTAFVGNLSSFCQHGCSVLGQLTNCPTVVDQTSTPVDCWRKLIE